jgi:hypothetical protein
MDKAPSRPIRSNIIIIECPKEGAGKVHKEPAAV